MNNDHFDNSSGDVAFLLKITQILLYCEIRNTFSNS